MNSLENEVRRSLSEINRAWRTNQPAAMQEFLHPNIVMRLPGFAGEVAGREALLSGFSEFCANARILEYSESDEQINVVGSCAVASFHFDMLYERAHYRERSRGRDLWVFQRVSDSWVAVWRTMVDLEEAREPRQ